MMEIQPFGRTLMAMGLARMTYIHNVNQKNLSMLAQAKKEAETSKKTFETWQDLSFNLTSTMLDKRFRTSKDFIASGGSISDDLSFRKKINESDQQMRMIVHENMIRARTSLQKHVSNYNQKIQDKKFATQVRALDLSLM